MKKSIAKDRIRCHPTEYLVLFTIRDILRRSDCTRKGRSIATIEFFDGEPIGVSFSQADQIPAA